MPAHAEDMSPAEQAPAPQNEDDREPPSSRVFIPLGQ